MTVRLLWRLADGHRLAPDASSALTLRTAGGSSVRLNARTAAVGEALQRLAGEGVDEEGLSALSTGPGDAWALFYLRSLLHRHGCLVADVVVDGVRWARLLPIRRAFSLPARWREAAAAPLSRFAHMRCEDGEMRLECTEAAADLILDDGRAVETLFRLRSTPGPLDEDARVFAALLSSLGFTAGEAEDPAMRTWEFHDRLLFARSRLTGDARPSGASFRFRDDMSPPPAEGAAFDGRRIPLPDGSADSGRSFRSLVMARRSRRAMGTRPVSLEALALLFDRVERALPPPADVARAGVTSRRPRPSGGALYELRFYLATRECEGLEPGFYCYDPHDNALVAVEGAAGPAEKMLASAAQGWRQPGEPPQALIVVSARHSRLAFKYEGIAYRLSLLHAGIALQGLYLACTELGLHGCAVGTGPQPLFAQATGLSSFEEASIAEFGFGTAPDPAG